MTSIASAPGKIVLCGEYAVLDGAPAICMAVNRRARTEVSHSDAGYHTVRAKGYIDGEWGFHVRKGGVLEWIGDASPAGDFGLLQEAMKPIEVSDSLDIGLDTSAFSDSVSGRKLGLGSSAALTAALVSALFDATDSPGDVLKESMAAHRRLQHGLGSGVDIATSITGGLIEYSVGESGAVRPLQWPAGLEYAVLWSGRPANTTEKLKKLNQNSGRTPATAALRSACEAVAERWSAGATDDLLHSLSRYTDALMQFDVDHELGIFDAGHKELTELAMRKDLLYKPCGAGGGDIGVILATDARAFPDFIHSAADFGYRPLDLSLETDGVRLES